MALLDLMERAYWNFLEYSRAVTRECKDQRSR